MSEIEIYAREDPTEIWQTPYVNGAGNSYLIPRDDDKLVYEFDKVSLWDFFYSNQISSLCTKLFKSFITCFGKGVDPDGV